MVTAGPVILAVSAKLPAQTLPELIALAKEKPGQLNYAIGGTRGSAPFLLMEQIKRATAIEWLTRRYREDSSAGATPQCGRSCKPCARR